MQPTLISLFLISASVCFSTSLKITNNFVACESAKKNRLGRVDILAKTDSDTIKGWRVFSSFVVPCDKLDTFQVETDTIVNGGLVQVDGDKQFFSGKGSTSAPVSARVFAENLEGWESAVDSGSIEAIHLISQNNKVSLSYKYVNPDLLKLLEAKEEDYLSGQTEYVVSE